MRAPPDRLGRVPARLRRLLLPLWLLLLAVTLVGQGGGLWYGHAYVTRISPAFASLRLDDVNIKQGDGFTIQSKVAAIPRGSRILRIDGHPLAGDATQLEASRLLGGPHGSKVALDIRTPQGEIRRLQLTRDSAQAGKTLRDRRNFTIGFIITFGLLALTYVGAALLLWRRKPDDPVSLLLSFAFLAIAGSGLGPVVFFDEIGADWIPKSLIPAWLLLLILVLPIFPDGRFVPRWSRWLLLLAPACVAISLSEVLPDGVAYLLLFLLLAASLSTPFLRYRRAPPGIERQQLKWAALGLGSGVALLTVGIIMAILLSKVAMPLPKLAVALGSLVFMYVGFLLIPAGVLISLLRYRLNDADAAIGRSTGYAAVTAIVGAVWGAPRMKHREEYPPREMTGWRSHPCWQPCWQRPRPPLRRGGGAGGKPGPETSSR